SELNSSADLDCSWPIKSLGQRESVRVWSDLGCDHAKVCPVLEVWRGIVEVWMVEDIEEVERQAEADLFGDLCLLSERHIELPLAEPSKHSTSSSSVLTQVDRSEAVECLFGIAEQVLARRVCSDAARTRYAVVVSGPDVARRNRSGAVAEDHRPAKRL